MFAARLNTPEIRRLSLPLLFVLAAPILAAAGEKAYSISISDAPEGIGRWCADRCEVAYDGSILRLQGGDGLVRYPHRLQDFQLELEWRPLRAAGWDSGIYFRSPAPPPNRPWPRQYQINLKEGQEGTLIGHPRGRVRGLADGTNWNRLSLTVKGTRGRLEINGKLAWELDDLRPEAGWLAIQSEVDGGGSFEFRKIRITEIGFSSLFDGESLDGWEPADTKSPSTWVAHDGLLVCQGGQGTWLRSKYPFGDSNVRLEYRLRDGGNSGVYIRVPKDGRHHGAGAGIEVQILDDAAAKYRTLRAYQYSASLYGIRGAEPRVARPAGTWNTLEIECRGTRYRVTHNGTVVVDTTAEDDFELAWRRTQGFLGLQNHKEHVEFRNLRIGPSVD